MLLPQNLKIKLIFLFSFGTFTLFSTPSDSSKFRLITKMSYHNGFLLPHRIAMQHIAKELTNGIEINFEKASNYSKTWEKLYNNPNFGVSFLYTSVGNKTLLGNALGVNFYLLLPIISTKKFKLQTSWGWGLGYIDKKFDRVHNYKNNAIGSNFNLFASIKIKSEMYINPSNAFLLGAAFNHWSNSGFRKPNLGINVPTVSIGLLHKFYKPINKGQKITKSEKKLLVPKEKNEFIAMPIIGFTSLNIHNKSIYTAYAFQLGYSRIWSGKYKINYTLDLFYNTAFRAQMNQNTETIHYTAFQTGLMAAYEQTIGRVGIILGWGAYIYDKTRRNDLFYHRFGTRFSLTKNWVLNTTLHTHWAVADHMEIGIGYKLKK